MANAHVKGSLDLLLLGVLRHGPAHGYAIIAALRERSAGEFDLAEGTIYPALHRLERSGLVSSSVELAQGRLDGPRGQPPFPQRAGGAGRCLSLDGRYTTT